MCAEYLDPITADRDYAAQLAASGSPKWVVHAEKGDGGLNDAEPATLASAEDVTWVTVPGSVFLLPDEAPDQTAAVIATALSVLPWPRAAALGVPRVAGAALAQPRRNDLGSHGAVIELWL